MPYLFDHFQFALIHGPNIPGSYAILLFTASNLASITSHIHNWILFLLCLCLFILSGIISSLISSSILGTYWPGEFIFQCPNFLPFHTVHGVLKARILKWLAITFSSGPHSVRPLHQRSWNTKSFSHQGNNEGWVIVTYTAALSKLLLLHINAPLIKYISSLQLCFLPQC